VLRAVLGVLIMPEVLRKLAAVVDGFVDFLLAVEVVELMLAMCAEAVSSQLFVAFRNFSISSSLDEGASLYDVDGSAPC